MPGGLAVLLPMSGHSRPLAGRVGHGGPLAGAGASRPGGKGWGMETLTYPGMPVRISGVVANFTHVFQSGLLGIFDGDPLDFGYRAPWVERAVFVARVRTPAVQVTTDDVIQVGIDLEVRRGRWQSLVVFPGYKAAAADGAANAGSIEREWVASVGPAEVAAELAPAAVSAGFTVGVGTPHAARLNNMPICGRLRPVMRLDGAYNGGQGHRVDLTLWMEGWARPQGHNWSR